ncbi:AraC family transcriptional regulator [Amycolatopsis balhimycina DSM 5908]|uniref:AraC family transcriptional regulator n=1 Tax=Amycolatopsis balhimycina DSM 5908 TaxID=1081091 RepID=A0A428W5P1_AMYBA|nr:helix-turn-helix domain-containing protein [Amycolatopsis balhimycina]RSM38399.1 AraC family transcriptional regulator [Amycolatopsis balhimycina DSM 5908]
MGHSIRPVRYEPPPGVTGEIELTSLARMRARGGPHEFLTPQRLGFDLLIKIEAGSAVHTVDFTGYPLAPGDLLWVRAGQVQQWGAIDDIDGPVFLFTPAAIDTGTWELIQSAGVATPSHWAPGAVAGTPAEAAMAAALAAAAAPAGNLRDAALARALAAALLLLVMAVPEGSGRRPPTHQAFVWFRDELEKSFRTRHQVAGYAARLGYSPRTLNRLARDNTGLSAKQLVDERIVLEAKRLLAHGRDPVARIAADLGFDDPSNFSKYFQHRTGTTPAAFRGAQAPKTMPVMQCDPRL